jgi:Beta-propeller repeat
MRNRFTRMIRPVGIALMLLTLTTSLIVRVPTTFAEKTLENRAASTQTSNLWPLMDSTSPLANPLAQPQTESSLQAQVSAAYNKLPLSFELNQGQTNSEVKFISRAAGYKLFLTSTEAVLAFKKACPYCEESSDDKSVKKEKRERKQPEEQVVLRMSLKGANPSPQVKGLDELPGKSNYLKGNDPTKWRTDVPHYARVRYEHVYTGVDMIYYGNQQQLEYDFIVAPGVDPKIIILNFEGALDLRLDAEGNLVLRTGAGEVTQHAPVIFQETEGGRQTIAGHYIIKENHQVGFEVPAYDKSKPLIIDPVVQYSTFLGGGNDDRGRGIAVDSAGSAYVTGSTDSTDFPTQNPLDTFLSGNSDAFITKFTPDGSALVYSTYIGGSLFDEGRAIAVTSDGKACITGRTGEVESNQQNNFPVTNNAFLPAGNSNRRDTDAFVTVLNASGSALFYSTFYGGSSINEGFGSDEANGIALDAGSNVYITGITASDSLPTKNGFQNSRRGLNPDAFIAKFNPSASTGDASFLYASYIGGRDIDRGNGIVVDRFNVAYIVGETDSDNFPTKSSSALQPFQKDNQPFRDGFIAKISPAQSGNSSLIYSTYLGGGSNDEAKAVAVDAFQRTYITGVAGSSDFPLKNPFDNQKNGVRDAFIMKMNADGTALFYSSFFGGFDVDEGRGIAVDSQGNAYITGTTNSELGFPLLNAFQSKKSTTDDAFVAKISAVPSTSIFPQILFSSFLGGSADDVGQSIALGPKRSIFVTGETAAVDFPTTPGAFQKDMPIGHGLAAFITRIAEVNDDTVGIFRPADITFRLRNTNTAGAPDITIGPNFYQAGDLPVTGDFNGDGVDTTGIFRIVNANAVFLVSDRTDGSVTAGAFFGQAGDLPIVGDWDGDGKDTIGVFRPSVGKFFLRNSNTAGPPDITVTFGAAVDIPLAGDWDGDGDDTIGVYRDSQHKFFLRNKLNAAPDIIVQFGIAGDVPITGDWDGDGDDTIGVFRNSNHKFFLRNFNNTGPANLIVDFGATNDIPLAGDWDGLSSNLPPNSGVNDPAGGASAVSQPQQFVTTCSDPDGWRNIHTIDFKISKSNGQGNGVPIALWVQFDQNSNLIRFYDPDTRTWSEGALGTNLVLSSRFAELHLAGTSIQGSGPTGPSVQVTWQVLFKEAAVQHNYKQYLRIEDDAGLSTDFDKVGSWSVTR